MADDLSPVAAAVHTMRALRVPTFLQGDDDSQTHDHELAFASPAREPAKLVSAATRSHRFSLHDAQAAHHISTIEASPTSHCGDEGSIIVPQRRSSRSEQRRAERSDLHPGYGSRRETNAAEEDSPRKVSTDALTGASDNSPDVPSGLNVRKARSIPKPSRPALARSPTAQAQIDAPTDRSRIPKTPGRNTSQEDESQARSSSSRKADHSTPNQVFTSNNESRTTLVPLTSASPTQSREKPRKFKPVAVCPPFPHKGRTAHGQWVDGHVRTSRPERAWGVPKRWKCCRCRAETMVEQANCSNLKCLHRYCEAACRVHQRPRANGQRFDSSDCSRVRA